MHNMCATHARFLRAQQVCESLSVHTAILRRCAARQHSVQYVGPDMADLRISVVVTPVCCLPTCCTAQVSRDYKLMHSLCNTQCLLTQSCRQRSHFAVRSRSVKQSHTRLSKRKYPDTAMFVKQNGVQSPDKSTARMPLPAVPFTPLSVDPQTHQHKLQLGMTQLASSLNSKCATTCHAALQQIHSALLSIYCSNEANREGLSVCGMPYLPKSGIPFSICYLGTCNEVSKLLCICVAWLAVSNACAQACLHLCLLHALTAPAQCQGCACAFKRSTIQPFALSLLLYMAWCISKQCNRSWLTCLQRLKSLTCCPHNSASALQLLTRLQPSSVAQRCVQGRRCALLACTGLRSQSKGLPIHDSTAHHLNYMLAGWHEQIALSFLSAGHPDWLSDYIAMLPTQLDDAIYIRWIKACGQHGNAAALQDVTEVQLHACAAFVLLWMIACILQKSCILLSVDDNVDLATDGITVKVFGDPRLVFLMHLSCCVQQMLALALVMHQHLLLAGKGTSWLCT